ncbi:hypothetical protein [Haloarcula sp. CGMCC 1.6347]|uniref:hypothetical protein n=1 Tax=Haloarcula sp. CGMCC 1.6347 TaxID=3111455 RepID=UPI00300EE594
MNLSTEQKNGAVVMTEDGEVSVEVGSYHWERGYDDEFPIEFEHDHYGGISGRIEMSPDEARQFANNILESLEKGDSQGEHTSTSDFVGDSR